MHLVHHAVGEVETVLRQVSERDAEGRHGQTLRRDEHILHAAVDEPSEGLLLLGGGEHRVYVRRSREASLYEAVVLVLHQRTQRVDHEDYSRLHHAGKLVCEGLAAAGGFGDVAAIFPELAGVTVEGRAESGAVALVVRAGGHVLGTAYAALTSDVEAAVWGLAEGNYLRDSDKFSVEMDAKACPEIPANLPWVAAIVWPILLHQESDAAYGNFWNVVVAATYGAAALLEGGFYTLGT